VCRYIIGFDTCPKNYRKNYREIFLNMLYALLLSFCGAIFFFAMTLLSAY
jgi:hypothetical protein